MHVSVEELTRGREFWCVQLAVSESFVRDMMLENDGCVSKGGGDKLVINCS